MTRTCAAIVVTLALATLVSRAQQVPTRDATGAPAPVRIGTGLIAGVVTDGVSHQPVRRALVTASDQAIGFARVSVTDDTGQFTFRNLSAGRYLVTATKAAYLPTAYGVNKPGRPGFAPTGTAFALAEGQQATNVALRITRGGVVTGVVRGTDGRPIRSATVSLAYSLRAPLTGDRTLAFLNVSTTTDVRGEYRMFGVPPGEYIASASMVDPFIGSGANDIEETTDQDVQRISQSRGLTATPAPVREPPRRPTYGYAPVFHPGTVTLANAAPIEVGPGEERSGVDFQIQLVPQARVSGVVNGPNGVPAPGVLVSMSTPSPYALGPFLARLTTTTDAQGQFVLRGVAAGDYVLDARVPTGRGGTVSSVTGWGRASVTVAPGADQIINVAMKAGLTVSGQLSLEPGSGPAPDFARARVSLINRDGLSWPATISPDGQFAIVDLSPDAYRFSISSPGAAGAPPWTVKSGAIGTRDAFDAFIDVTDPVTNASVVLTQRVSEISGAILDAAGRPAPEFVIVIFPSDNALWAWGSRRIQQARPSHDGKFSFKSLPPGDYQLAAVTDVEPYEWFEPKFLTQLLAASGKVTLADGEKKVQDIRLR